MNIGFRLINASKRQIQIFDWTNPIGSLILLSRFLRAKIRRLSKSWDRKPIPISDFDILVLGGLGDLIVASRYLSVLFNKFNSGIRINIYSTNPSQLKWLIEGSSSVHVSFVDELKFPKASTVPRMQIGHEILFEKTTINKMKSIMKDPSWLDTFSPRFIDAKRNERFMPGLSRIIAETASLLKLRRSDYIFHTTKLDYPGDVLKISVEKFDTPDHFVTIHNGYDENFILSNNTSTKNYEYMEEVARYVTEELGVEVLQLGVSSTSRRLESATCLIDRTSLQEAAYIISKSLFHIDVESGLVHLAAAVGKKSIVLFGPTPSQYFGYQSNINIQIHNCSPCWWENIDWMNRCKLREDKHKCLRRLDPSLVCAAVQAHLKTLS